MPSPDGLAVAARRQSLERILADGLEHSQARLVPACMLGREQVVPEERLDPLQDVEVGLLRDALGGGQREPADEDGEAREELLLFRLQEVVAPLDRRAERPLPLGEHRSPAPPAEDRASSRDARAGRRARADCSAPRRARAPAADRRAERRARSTDSAFVSVSSKSGRAARARSTNSRTASIPPQLRKRGTLRPIRQLERRHRVDPFLRHPERSAARDEQLHAGCAGQQLAQERGSVEHVLEVVEQQQRLPLAQVLDKRLPRRVSRPFLDPELVGDRPRDEYRVGDAAELDQHGACGPAFGNAGHLERQARLPRSGGTSQRQQPHLLAAQKRPDLPQLTRPPHEGRRATLQAGLRLRCAVGRGLGGDVIERRILVEDRAFELPERERRLDAERLDERAPRIAIRRERVRLPSRAVEGDHQLGAEALPERVLADQQLQFADELGTRAKREIRLDPLLEGFEPKLLEPSDLGLRPGLVGELGQRLSSPERERLPQHRVRVGRGGSPRSPDELLEPEQVERPRIGSELVRRGGGPDHDAAQRPAELQDVLLQDLRRGGGRSSAPQIVDQAVTRHELVRVEEQDREERTLLRRVQGNHAALGDRLEWPEDAEFHGETRPGSYTRLGRRTTRRHQRSTIALPVIPTLSREGAATTEECDHVRFVVRVQAPARRRPRRRFFMRRTIFGLAAAALLASGRPA